MSGRVTPDPERLAALRGTARGYLERKRRWTKVLFVIAAICETSLFGAMLVLFDFSERLYWFIFLGMCFVYSPLITMIYRTSIMLDRMYYRLLIELKFGGSGELDGRPLSEGPEDIPLSFERDASEEIRQTYAKKSRWGIWLFVIAGVFEASLFGATLYFMDFSNQLDWFLFFGFMGVYTPLVISAWRNTISIDRVFYGLIDELKYVDSEDV